MKDTAQRFEDFELENSLFDIWIDGIPLWERMRFPVYRAIESQTGTGQAHAGINTGIRGYLKGLSLFLRNFVSRNPYLSGKTDLLYFGHPRRKKTANGYWTDIYCDPIHESSNFDYVHLEKDYHQSHKQPPQTENLRYLDIISYGSKIQQKMGINCPDIPSNKEKVLEEVQKIIHKEFEAHINLLELAYTQLHIRRTKLWMYRRLLDRIDPEIVIVVVSYGDETLIEACKEHGTPVVEFQHGVIYPSHFGYSYEGPRTKKMFPDYLFTFGDFWKESVEFPIPDEQVISVGYPYLERSIRRYEESQPDEQIIFISQGTVGEQLSKFALEVDRDPRITYDVVYKLHPGEYDRWKDEYPWLVEANFEVIDDSDRQLYQLFAESSIQIGVGSTAVYEGLCFDLKTYVYDCPGAGTLQPLLDQGAADLVSSTDQLAALLGQGVNDFDRDFFFAPNAIEQVCKNINQIISNN